MLSPITWHNTSPMKQSGAQLLELFLTVLHCHLGQIVVDQDRIHRSARSAQPSWASVWKHPPSPSSPAGSLPDFHPRSCMYPEIRECMTTGNHAATPLLLWHSGPRALSQPLALSVQDAPEPASRPLEQRLGLEQTNILQLAPGLGHHSEDPPSPCK